MEKQLRKYQHSLIIIGIGVILFGIWSVLKVFMHYTLDYSQFTGTVNSVKQNMDSETTAVVSDKAIAFVIYFITIIFVILIILFRFYIGMSAIREGQGRLKGKGILYLVFAAILVFLNGMSVYGNILHFNDYSGSYNSIYDKVSSLVVDITSLFTLIELIIDSIRLKHFSKKLQTKTVNKDTTG